VYPLGDVSGEASARDREYPGVIVLGLAAQLFFITTLVAGA
jgi:hypothetical protein